MLENWNTVKPGDILTIHQPGQTRAHKMRVVTIEPSAANPDDYAYLIGERLRMNGKPSSVPSGARKALPKGQRFEFVGRHAVTAVEPATPKIEGDWTIAYRTPRANRFQRVTNWSGSWDQAREMAGIMVEATGLQVYYVPTARYERDEQVRHENMTEKGLITFETAERYRADHGNILMPTGKRVRMVETGTVSAELVAKMRHTI